MVPSLASTFAITPELPLPATEFAGGLPPGNPVPMSSCTLGKIVGAQEFKYCRKLFVVPEASERYAMVIGVDGKDFAIRGLSLAISALFHVVIAPPKIFASVTCLSWIDDPKVRPVVAFLRLIGTVIAPPIAGMYSQPNVGAPDAYAESLIAYTKVPLVKLPLPVPEPVEVYETVKLLCEPLKSAAHCCMKTFGKDAPPPEIFSAA